MLHKAEHSAKAESPISFIEGGNCTTLSDEHFANVLYSMHVTPSGTLTDVNDLQPSNAFSPMLDKWVGNWIIDKDSQFSNALLPILVNVGGKSTDVSDLQLSNTASGNLSTLVWDRFTDRRLSQPINADFPIFRSVRGNTTPLKFILLAKAESSIVVTPLGIVIKEGASFPNHPLQRVPLSYNNRSLYSSELHLSNTLSPIVVIESGILMLVKEVQPQNADSPMFVTESGMWMLVNDEQPQNADSPMLVIVSGMSTWVNDEQSSNISSLI